MPSEYLGVRIEDLFAPDLLFVRPPVEIVIARPRPQSRFPARYRARDLTGQAVFDDPSENEPRSGPKRYRDVDDREGKIRNARTRRSACKSVESDLRGTVGGV